MSNLNWYVIRAVSGQEKKIKTYLENEITRQGLQEFIPEILIPSEKIYEVRNNKKVVREKNLFPGYIIVSADLSHGEANHLITSMPNVLGFLGNMVGTSKVPVPLRQAEINRILGKVEESIQEVETAKVSFSRGENVKINDGPFSGFVGTVEEIHDDKKKLAVVVKIFGRNTPVELGYAQVEKES
jgi:transcription termination/antitermination protein NusG